jgi:hypothetical protein
MTDEPLKFPKIEGMKDTRNGDRPKIFRCEDCVFFSIDLANITTGFCHGNPPTMLMNQREGSVMVMRPKVGADNIACRHLSIAQK